MNNVFLFCMYPLSMTFQNASVSKLEELIWKLEKLVHKNHYHCYTVKHTLIQLYGREKGYSNCELTEEHLQRKIGQICLLK